MTNEQIRSACERAVTLASAIEQDDLRGVAFGQILAHLLRGPDVTGTQTSAHPKTVPSQIPSPKSKPATLGLKARLVELHSGGFFVEPKTGAQIAEELKSLGWIHKTKEISARLQGLTRGRLVRRSPMQGRKGSYLYSNW